jgi:1-aminocyclopropane-1-carboxylate deaminase/D-cysteine desulfhydrase-like pyridoxal-dependent ACC family enzyme
MISEFPRFPLALLPTPLHRARRVEAALGVGPLLLKRDDLIGFGVAGNKARPLEFLVGVALAEGADVIVTGGGPGSNFCPAAAMAARAGGLDCELVVWGEPGRAVNIALAIAAGATIVTTGSDDREAVDALVEERAATLRAEGRRPYAVPRGGSTPLGAVGYAAAAAELTAQLAPLPEPPALVVLAVGSGGSCAGLVAGLAAAGLTTPVLGVSVSRPPSAIEARVKELAEGCAALIGGPPPPQPVLIDARGPGFGTASPRERERAGLALRTEGLLLDETYGAEAFSAAVDRMLAGPGGPVVYWHTGGLLPAVDKLTRGAP